jgi:hypothetical protein
MVTANNTSESWPGRANYGRKVASQTVSDNPIFPERVHSISWGCFYKMMHPHPYLDSFEPLGAGVVGRCILFMISAYT